MAGRLVVNVNDEAEELLASEKRSGITATETTRRALSVLKWLYEQVRAGNRIVVVTPDEKMTEVRFIW